MKKSFFMLGILLVALLSISLFAISAEAKDQSGKRTPLLSATCDASTVGKLKYSNGCMAYCDGSQWVSKYGCKALT
ncbi:MAG: hypothetical protein LBP53_04220 [Candidatus Peribacteria bacterium]|jgi:hypothetical protein|nr:hypothetical protein [Candidatus Peribacteria bacterium]